MNKSFSSMDLLTKSRHVRWLFACLLVFAPMLAFASSEPLPRLNLTAHWAGFTAIGIFVLAYIFVILEEVLHLKKSVPVMLAAGVIWAILAVVASQTGDADLSHSAVKAYLIEFSELFLFLLAAMTYVNAMSERNVFEVLRARLVNMGLNYKQLFWITGVLAFFLSPIIDNLTTALVLCAVLLAVGRDSPKFISIGCVNVVVSANAGGAFSPFGDITTLMVWQRGILEFTTFFALFVPSVVNYMVPAIIMSFFIPNGKPPASDAKVELRRGAIMTLVLFALTIITAVSFHNFLHLPPYLGMLTGLAYLKIFGYYLERTAKKFSPEATSFEREGTPGDIDAFDSFELVARAEWDTLLFFFGVIMCVGALGFCGYLAMASGYFYGELGPDTANILVGILSAIVDNIPVMVAVLQMQPEMSAGDWLMVTLTAGVGGSMLSVGSAAGVALMGQARGKYTFFSHLKWTPAIALGYFLSIWVNHWWNAHYFLASVADH